MHHGVLADISLMFSLSMFTGEDIVMKKRKENKAEIVHRSTLIGRKRERGREKVDSLIESIFTGNC